MVGNPGVKAVDAFMARWNVPGSLDSYDCLVIVLRPDPAAGELLDLGGYAFLSDSPDASSLSERFTFLLPLARAMKGTPAGGPYKVLRPEGGWTDIGMVLLTTRMPPPPLVFDVTDVPAGRYWIHLADNVVPIDIHHEHRSRPVDGRRPAPG